MSEAESSPAPSGRKIPLLPLLLILLLLGVALFGDRGILRVMQLRRERATLQKQVQSLETTNAGLRQEIHALRSDRRYWRTSPGANRGWCARGTGLSIQDQNGPRQAPTKPPGKAPAP